MKIFPKNLLTKLFIPLIIFYLAFSYYKSQASDFDSLVLDDERPWITRAFYLELFLHGDFKNDLWKTYNLDADPKLPEYIFGLVLYPDYLRVRQNKGKDYDMIRYLMELNFYDRRLMSLKARPKYEKFVTEKYFFWNADEFSQKTLKDFLEEYGGAFDKTAETIIKARLGSVFFLSLSLVVAYFIYLTVFNNPYLSVIVALFYGASSLVVYYGTKAYTEPFFLFFVNLTVFFFVLLFSKSQKHKLISVIVLAFIIALTNQVKINGIILLFIYVSLSVIALLSKKTTRFAREALRLLGNIALLFSLFLFIYVLLDPYLYENPVKNIKFQYVWTQAIAKEQQAWKNTGLYSPTDRLRFIASLFSEKLPVNAKNIVILYPKFLDVKNTNLVKIFHFFVKFLFILGVAHVILLTYVKKKLTKEAIITIVFVLFCIPLLFYLIVKWERYLIHLVFFIFFFAGQGVRLVIDVLKKEGGRFTRKSLQLPPSNGRDFREGGLNSSAPQVYSNP